MKTKVMHLISGLPMGGAETLITDYALNIDKEKFEMVIVTIGEHKNTINEKKLRKQGIKVIFLGDHVLFANTKNVIKKIVRKIHRHILFQKTVKQENPHIIHTHLNVNEYIISMETKKRQVKFFHTIHAKLNALFRKKNNRLITKYCIKRKGMMPIALQSKMQEETKAFFDTDSCLVVPNAINVKRFANAQIDKSQMLETLKINKESFIIGHVGRFDEAKNHQFLIDVFAAAKQKRADAHLILIGIGKLEDQIKQQVKEAGLQDSVSFLGNRGDIPELMGVMDVFVFPSLFEGFGNVLVEAQAAGVRCVASDTIPGDAFVTNLVTSLSLNDPVETWCETVVNGSRPKKIEGDLFKHDINNVIDELENIYLDAGV